MNEKPMNEEATYVAMFGSAEEKNKLALRIKEDDKEIAAILADSNDDDILWYLCRNARCPLETLKKILYGNADYMVKSLVLGNRGFPKLEAELFYYNGLEKFLLKEDGALNDLAAILVHEKSPESIIRKIFSYDYPAQDRKFLADALARNERAPADLLETLGDSISEIWLAKNPNTSPERLERIADRFSRKGGDSFWWKHITSNPSCPSSVFRKVLEECEASTVEVVVKQKIFPCAVARDYLKSGHATQDKVTALLKCPKQSVCEMAQKKLKSM